MHSLPPTNALDPYSARTRCVSGKGGSVRQPVEEHDGQDGQRLGGPYPSRTQPLVRFPLLLPFLCVFLFF